MGSAIQPWLKGIEILFKQVAAGNVTDKWPCGWEVVRSWSRNAQHIKSVAQAHPSAAPVTRSSSHAAKMNYSAASREVDDHSRRVLKGGKGLEMKDGRNGGQEELKVGH